MDTYYDTTKNFDPSPVPVLIKDFSEGRGVSFLPGGLTNVRGLVHSSTQGWHTPSDVTSDKPDPDIPTNSITTSSGLISLKESSVSQLEHWNRSRGMCLIPQESETPHPPLIVLTTIRLDFPSEESF